MKYEIKNGTYINEREELVDFQYYTDVPIIRKVNFINRVVELVVDQHYYSIIKDLIFDFMLVSIFTDIDVSDMEDFTSIENFIDLGVADIVKAGMNQDVLDELIKAVNDAIEYKTGIHKNILIDSLASLVSTLDNTVQKLDSDEMVNIIKKLSDASDGLTTDNIMQSYMKSDAFGKTVDELKQQRDNETKMIDFVASQAVKNQRQD